MSVLLLCAGGAGACLFRYCTYCVLPGIISKLQDTGYIAISNIFCMKLLKYTAYCNVLIYIFFYLFPY